VSDGRKSRPTASGRGTENRFFAEQRLGLWAGGVALGYFFALALRLIRHEWVTHPETRPCTDFIWIWLSSKFALSGALAHAYDYSQLSTARAVLVGPPNCILEHFDYPPTLLFYTYPLGAMPYPVAFAIWVVATLLLYLAAVYALIPRPAAVIAAMTPFPVFFNVLMGHNGFLSAGLVGLALAFAEPRPRLSGIFLGLLTYKPQLGILFPFALLAARNWRALLSAAAASLVFAASAAVAFGYQTWPAFIHALTDRAWSSSEAPGQAFTLALVSVFGFLRTAGVSAEISWAVQLAVSAIVTVMVCALWARPIPYSLKAASLAIGSLLASPHVHGYDVCILTIGVAFLVKDGLARGFLPRERGVMLGCWAGLFLLTGPIPAIVGVVLLVLVVRRAVRLPNDALVAPHPALQMQGQVL
jgi:Glycosyltransferase family 87